MSSSSADPIGRKNDSSVKRTTDDNKKEELINKVKGLKESYQEFMKYK